MRILFCGGGTLGHIYPLVCICEELKKNGHTLYFIGTKSGLEKEFIDSKDLFFKKYYFDSEGLKRKLSLKNIIVILKHLNNIINAKKILKQEKIDIAIGMGGFVSASVIYAASSLKIKTLIHEQNAIMGLANKIVKNKVDKVLLSYPIEGIKNAVVVGNPRVSEIYEKYKYENPNLGNYLLVVGGSRGAKKINDTIISLKKELNDLKVNVILVTGNKYYNENKELIEKNNTYNFKIIPFINDLPRVMLNAILVITRAGATTLSEVIALRKVCIIIPSPNVTNNHQEENAKHLLKVEGAVVFKESDLEKEKLLNEIKKLFFDKEVRNKIINNIEFNFKYNAKDLFLNEINNIMDIGKN